MRYSLLFLLASASFAQADDCPINRAVFSVGSHDAFGNAYAEKISDHQMQRVWDVTIDGKRQFITTTVVPMLETKTEISADAPAGFSFTSGAKFGANDIYGGFAFKGCR